MKPTKPIIILSAVPLLWIGGLVGAAAGNVAVDGHNQTGTSDGSARHPYATLQAALDAAVAGDIVQVAAGTYAESVEVTDKSLQILGGYAGGSIASYALGSAGSFTTRDPEANPVIIQGTPAGATVTLRKNEAALAGTILDGFTIRGGRHGILMEDNSWPPSLADVTISHNVVEGNGVEQADDHVGGGIAVVGIGVEISNNLIRNNRGGRGGGIGSAGEIRDLLVRDNVVENNLAYGDHGGGLYLGGSSRLIRNVIQGNRSGENLGYGWGGGIIIFNPGSASVMEDNILRNNVAPSAGGGVCIDEGAEATLTHVLIYGNSVGVPDGYGGAGIYVDGAGASAPGDPQSHLQMINCTVADNIGPNLGGNAVLVEQSTAVVTNSIFWNNSGTLDFVVVSGTEASLVANHCLTQAPTPGPGNLSEDPLFADPGSADYHLRSADGRWDPAANAGTGGWVSDPLSSPALDWGDPGSSFAMEPLPNGSQINLGAYGNTAEASRSSATPNVPPSDIALSGQTLEENLPAGTLIGTFTATDANPGDSHSYGLVPGAGDGDNGLFAIEGDTLRAVVPLDYETRSRYSIRVRVTDKKGAAFDKVFEIELSNANDPPRVQLASPLNGMQIEAGVGVSLWSTASDEDGSVESVGFIVNGRTVGSGSLIGKGWLWSWMPAAAGRYVLSARVVDNLGASRESEPVTVVVQAAGPGDPPVIPGRWESRGVGGGGALFSPSINPHNPNELYVGCDMSEWFRSINSGRSWEVLDFGQIQGGNLTSSIQFTSDPAVLYGLDFSDDLARPAKSIDGGLSWTVLAADPTAGESYSLLVDPERTARLLVSSYDTLYFSDDGGGSFKVAFQAADCHVAGAFFDGADIFIGTRAGLVVSTDGGGSFGLAPFDGIPATEAMVSFAGAKQAGVVRLFCVTHDAGSVYPGVTGADHWSYLNIYRFDYGVDSGWTAAATGIGGAHPVFVAMARNQTSVAYVAGATVSPDGPVVFKTANGGATWEQVFETQNNRNIATGWQGDGGDRHWSYGEYALGFAVCPNDSGRLAISDLGFVHISTDGGASWRQAYVDPLDENPAMDPTPTGKTYHGVGLENTSCWWLTWDSPENLFACFTDVRGVRSVTGGRSWSFDYSGLDLNSSYHCVKDPSSGRLYLAVSSVHDLYESAYLNDERVDGTALNPSTGAVLVSEDGGANWSVLHDFGHPVIWLALDPNHADRLYASVIHHSDGGIHVTDNLGDGAGSAWTRLAAPPRTEGHPFNIRVLDDGTLVCSYSGRTTESGFTASSGVFVSTDGGSTWLDRSDPGMHYWTKDLVVDPHDPGQQTWYAAVFSGWGGPANDLGGVYRTVNRGVSWTRITGSQLNRVESCTISPVDPDVMLVTTETQGLWYSADLGAASPAFAAASAYPFKHPTRVFFNPSNAREVWVTSFGNGLRVSSRSPVLEVIRRGGDVTVSWPLAAGDGWRLQVSPDLNPPIPWEEVSRPYPSTGDRHTVSEPTTAAKRFYRLIQP